MGSASPEHDEYDAIIIGAGFGGYSMLPRYRVLVRHVLPLASLMASFQTPSHGT